METHHFLSLQSFHSQHSIYFRGRSESHFWCGFIIIFFSTQFFFRHKCLYYSTIFLSLKFRFSAIEISLMHLLELSSRECITQRYNFSSKLKLFIIFFFPFFRWISIIFHLSFCSRNAIECGCLHWGRKKKSTENRLCLSITKQSK